MGSKVKVTGKKPRVGDGTPGPGRPKGGHNRLTGLVREGISRAYREIGAHKWLVKLAHDEPRAFAMLLAKTMPTQVAGIDDGPIKFENVTADPKVQAAAMGHVHRLLAEREERVH